MTRKRFLLRIGFLLAVAGLLAGCQRSAHLPVKHSRLLLGTFVEITDYDSDIPRSQVEAAIDSAFSLMGRFEKQINPFDSASAIARINRATHSDSVFEIDSLLAGVIHHALAIAAQSQGAFDISIWPVFKLWHFGTDSAIVPDPQSIREALPLVNWKNIRLKGQRLHFLQKGMQLDLSGISKGFAVELARGVLKSKGLRNFIVDAGGNLGVEWNRPDSIAIYVRHPRQAGAFWGKFPVQKSCGIATSGDYQNYFIQDSLRYHHLLNPQTGYPARELVSVTVVAPNAIEADGYSTAVFVMGKARGQRFLQSRPDLEGLLIYPEADSLATYLTPNLKPQFQFLNP